MQVWKSERQRERKTGLRCMTNNLHVNNDVHTLKRANTAGVTN